MEKKKKINKKPTTTKRKYVKKPKKSNAGRKLFDGKPVHDVLAKLETAFSIGATDEEACVQADISMDALYRYERKHEAFRNRKHLLKEKLVLLARNNVAKVMQEKNALAQPTERALASSWRYLERKKKNEFAPHSTVDTKLEETIVISEEQEADFAERVGQWKKTGSKVKYNDERAK